MNFRSRWIFLAGTILIYLQSRPIDSLSAGGKNNWPHWRGPNANGIVEKGNPPIAWSQTKNLKWKVKIPGRGSATPIVWDKQIFILSALKTDRLREKPPEPRDAPRGVDEHPTYELPGAPKYFHQFLVMSFNRETGKILWKKVATEKVPHRRHHISHGYASGSPVTDGKYLYVSFGSQGFFCFDLKGNLRWLRDLGQMEKYLDFGEAVTPVVYGNKVVVVHDHVGDSYIIAMDTKTGETKWKIKRHTADSWATPLLVPYDNTYQVIVTGRRLRSYDLTDGRHIWHCTGIPGAVVPSPVEYDGSVIVASGYPGSLMLSVPLNGKGYMESKIQWTWDKDLPYVPTPLVYENIVYFFKDKTTRLTGLDVKTGKVVFPAKRLAGLKGNLYSSPVAAQGRMYFTDKKGNTVVLKKNGKKLETLAVNRLDDPVNASLAIVGDQIILRSREHLYCFEQK